MASSGRTSRTKLVDHAYSPSWPGVNSDSGSPTQSRAASTTSETSNNSPRNSISSSGGNVSPSLPSNGFGTSSLMYSLSSRAPLVSGRDSCTPTTMTTPPLTATTYTPPAGHQVFVPVYSTPPPTTSNGTTSTSTFEKETPSIVETAFDTVHKRISPAQDQPKKQPQQQPPQSQQPQAPADPFTAEIDKYLTQYKNDLLQDTMPFWIKHGIDQEYGGYSICLGEDGTRINPDRPMWAHGRFAWLLATLYNTVEQKDEWLQLAKHGVDFIRKHGFDRDGRMFYSLTEDGKPLRKRRYIFTETFTIIALAAYGKAAQDSSCMNQAHELFMSVLSWLDTPGKLEAKVNPVGRQTKGLAIPMIMMVTAQELRLHSEDEDIQARLDEFIEKCITEIESDFVKDEFRAVLECVGKNGEFIDTFEGRAVNPGHAIEAGWFILHEAKHRKNKKEWVQLGLKIIDYSLEQGWDESHGGIINLRDCKNIPCVEYWHDQKFWWPQCECLIATLYAYHLTKDKKYWEWHNKIHQWAHTHFPDKVHGEWYGYLHRDGRVSTTVKGNMFKGPFHIPRAQLVCWKLLEDIKSEHVINNSQ